jgi:hypothetical protein
LMQRLLKISPDGEDALIVLLNVYKFSVFQNSNLLRSCHR